MIYSCCYLPGDANKMLDIHINMHTHIMSARPDFSKTANCRYQTFILEWVFFTAKNCVGKINSTNRSKDFGTSVRWYAKHQDMLLCAQVQPLHVQPLEMKLTGKVYKSHYREASSKGGGRNLFFCGCRRIPCWWFAPISFLPIKHSGRRGGNWRARGCDSNVLKCPVCITLHQIKAGDLYPGRWLDAREKSSGRPWTPCMVIGRTSEQKQAEAWEGSDTGQVWVDILIKNWCLI